ncbi:unnamed protein product, partial [Staurois parvus]
MIGADPRSDNCRALMISALMIGAQQCHPQVLPSSAPTSSAHLCPAVHPPVPLCSVPHLCHSAVSHTCAQ